MALLADVEKPGAGAAQRAEDHAGKSGEEAGARMECRARPGCDLRPVGEISSAAIPNGPGQDRRGGAASATSPRRTRSPRPCTITPRPRPARGRRVDDRAEGSEVLVGQHLPPPRARDTDDEQPDRVRVHRRVQEPCAAVITSESAEAASAAVFLRDERGDLLADVQRRGQDALPNDTTVESRTSARSRIARLGGEPLDGPVAVPAAFATPRIPACTRARLQRDETRRRARAGPAARIDACRERQAGRGPRRLDRDREDDPGDAREHVTARDERKPWSASDPRTHVAARKRCDGQLRDVRAELLEPVDPRASRSRPDGQTRRRSRFRDRRDDRRHGSLDIGEDLAEVDAGDGVRT